MITIKHLLDTMVQRHVPIVGGSPEQFRLVRDSMLVIFNLLCCSRCDYEFSNHKFGKCLFSATQYRAYTMQDLVRLAQSPQLTWIMVYAESDLASRGVNE